MDRLTKEERLQQLRVQVLKANQDLYATGLAFLTFGNVSGIDRASGLMVIKPSGIDYSLLTPEGLVLCDLQGNTEPDALRPSSDLATHLHLYRNFPDIGAVVHTHSNFGTTWAQAGFEIPALGTTHADYFHGSIPITEELTDEEIESDYELNTGRAITRLFVDREALAMPGVLVRGHAPFCWGRTPAEAVHHALVLERVAQMALQVMSIDVHAPSISTKLLDRHYQRKHGTSATYGQAG